MCVDVLLGQNCNWTGEAVEQITVNNVPKSLKVRDKSKSVLQL